MVATEQEEVLWIFDLVSEKETDGLEGLFTPVYVVTEEQVVTLWGEASILKEAQQVIVLAVDISCRHGRGGGRYSYRQLLSQPVIAIVSYT